MSEKRDSGSVGTDRALNPGDVVANLGVDSWMAFLGTSHPPGDNSLELPIAHNRATRVSLNKKRMKALLLQKDGDEYVILIPWVIGQAMGFK